MHIPIHGMSKWSPGVLGMLLLSMIATLSSCVVAEPACRELGPGDVGHAGSGILFPERLGAFRRGDIKEYNEEGTDVGAAYTRFHLLDRLNATLFVFPAPALRADSATPEETRAARKRLMEMEFEGIKAQVISHNPGAENVLEDDSVMMLCGKERDAISANFIWIKEVAFMDIPYVSFAILISVDQWFVLIRLTAPEDSIERSLKETVGFLQAFAEANDGKLLEGDKGIPRELLE